MSYDYSETVEYLLDWFELNARILPWRQNPTPYHVWISEIMLQQTRVEAVKGYFDRFTKELPDIAALANVEEEKLLKLWEGLGYYNRARNLKKTAQIVMETYQGSLPANYNTLLTLPGIGSYTAGAIASIAFGLPEPAVDGNVLRVMKRIAGSFDDITKDTVKKELEKDIRAIIPNGRAGAYNQSLMELGAIVCLPNRKPLCSKCPVMHLCHAFHNETWDRIPVKPAKKARKIEKKTIFILEQDGKFLLHKRPKGLLSGMWEFPALVGTYGIEKAEEFLQSCGFELLEPIRRIGEAKHIFSHIEWHMTGYYARGKVSEDAKRNTISYFTVAEPTISYSTDSIQPKPKEEQSEEQKKEILAEQEFRAGIEKKGQNNYRYADAKEIYEQISLPSAFEAYRKVLFSIAGFSAGMYKV